MVRILSKEAMKQKRQAANLPSVRSSVFGFMSAIALFVFLQVVPPTLGV